MTEEVSGDSEARTGRKEEILKISDDVLPWRRDLEESDTIDMEEEGGWMASRVAGRVPALMSHTVDRKRFEGK